MKVKEIIKALEKENQEQEVLLYIGEAEEYGNTGNITLIKEEDDLPYGKGDSPEMTNKGILLIKGGII